MPEVTETAYDAYLRLREYWHGIVLQRDEADEEEKDALYNRLARSWARLNVSERRCAGMHAKLVYHGAERR